MREGTSINPCGFRLGNNIINLYIHKRILIIRVYSLHITSMCTLIYKSIVYTSHVVLISSFNYHFIHHVSYVDNISLLLYLYNSQV